MRYRGTELEFRRRFEGRFPSCRERARDVATARKPEESVALNDRRGSSRASGRGILFPRCVSTQVGKTSQIAQDATETPPQEALTRKSASEVAALSQRPAGQPRVPRLGGRKAGEFGGSPEPRGRDYARDIDGSSDSANHDGQILQARNRTYARLGR
jgi:hypothetical protein